MGWMLNPSPNQALKKTQSRDPNHCPGLVLSSSTTGFLKEGARSLYIGQQPTNLTINSEKIIAVFKYYTAVFVHTLKHMQKCECTKCPCETTHT